MFALACGIGAGLVAGTWPALRLPWTHLVNVLRDGGRSGSAGSLHGRTRQALVVAEIALTVMVLSGAVLLTKSLLRLEAIDPGFRPDGIVTFRLSLPDDSYGRGSRRALRRESREPTAKRTGRIVGRVRAFAPARPSGHVEQLHGRGRAAGRLQVLAASPSGTSFHTDYFSAMTIGVIARARVHGE